eukprot:6187080-Pleurochrysis_carterae.AAC.1
MFSSGICAHRRRSAFRTDQLASPKLIVAMQLVAAWHGSRLRTLLRVQFISETRNDETSMRSPQAYFELSCKD